MPLSVLRWLAKPPAVTCFLDGEPQNEIGFDSCDRWLDFHAHSRRCTRTSVLFVVIFSSAMALSVFECCPTRHWRASSLARPLSATLLSMPTFFHALRRILLGCNDSAPGAQLRAARCPRRRPRLPPAGNVSVGWYAAATRRTVSRFTNLRLVRSLLEERHAACSAAWP